MNKARMKELILQSLEHERGGVLVTDRLGWQDDAQGDVPLVPQERPCPGQVAPGGCGAT